MYSAYISLRFLPKSLNSYGGRTKAKTTYRFLPSYLSAIPIPLECDFGDGVISLDVFSDHETDVSYPDYLLQIMHESARLISDRLKNHESYRNCPKLAKAWVGVDVAAWHRCIAYQVLSL